MLHDPIVELANRLQALERRLAVQETQDAVLSVLYLVDGVTAPATQVVAQIYVDTSDGDLKVKFSDGTVKTIVSDT